MAALKRLSPWIACLAVVLNLLAMPLSRAMQSPDPQMLLWGGFCGTGSAPALSPALSKVLDNLAPLPPAHAMQHGDCCCGHAGLAAVPANYYRHFLPQYSPDVALDNPPLPTLHPRIRWPSLTPRASPIA